jgi:hypothetical protein
MWWCLVAVVGAAIVCVRLSGSVQNSYIVERIPSPWQKKKNRLLCLPLLDWKLAIWSKIELFFI